jgi:hypothetical protein
VIVQFRVATGMNTTTERSIAAGFGTKTGRVPSPANSSGAIVGVGVAVGVNPHLAEKESTVTPLWVMKSTLNETALA